MEDYFLVIYILIAVLIFLIGFGLGKKLRALKTSFDYKNLETNHLHLQNQLENLQSQIAENALLHQKEKTDLKNDYENRIREIKTERENFRKEKDYKTNQLTLREAEFSHLRQKMAEQKTELEKLQEKFHHEFENLAGKIFEHNSLKFTELNKSNIENILNPLKEKIKGFEEKIQKSREDSLTRHVELGKQLELLNEQNIRISEEALNLTKALKGDQKTQGNWGEMLLEKVLELSGLQKNREYFVQQQFKNEANRAIQPDVIIHLPKEKRIIIDSKVSLVAYERYINTEDFKEKDTALKQHILSLKTHITDLGRKNYAQIYPSESPDFVLLFIPIEAAFALATQEYPNLYNDAFQKNIILVTPTTLLAVLKTIDSMWQNENQQQNALEIAKRAGKLYDTFVNLIQDFEKVGGQIHSLQNSYEGAMKKLTGNQNLIKDVEKLRKLGAKTGKEIPKNLLNS